MTARRLKGLDAIRDAAVQAPPAIHVLVLDDVPRTGLSTKEVAAMFGLPYRWITDRIKEGRIRVLHEGLRGYVIPVAELAEIASWAERLDPTA